MQHIIKGKLLLVFFLFHLSSQPAYSTNYNMKAYNRWASLETALLNNMGLKYMSKAGMEDSALLCYSIIANRYYENPESEKEIRYKSLALNNLGYLYFFHYFDYAKSYSYLDKSKELSERYHLQHILPMVYINIGNLILIDGEMNGTSGHIDNALVQYKKAFYASLAVKDWRNLTNTFINLQSMSFQLGDKINIKKEIKIFIKQKMPDTMHLREYIKYLNIATLAYYNKNYTKAIQAFDRAANHVDTPYTPERFTMLALFNKAIVLRKDGQINKSIQELMRVKSIAEKNKARDALVDINNTLSDIYKNKGDKLKASHYQLASLLEKDSVLHYNRLGSVDNLHFVNQIKTVNDQIIYLSAQHRIKNIILISVSTLLILALIFLMLFYQKYRKLQNSNKQLYLKFINSLKEEENREQKHTMASPLLLEPNNVLLNDKQIKQHAQLLEKIKEIIENTNEIYSETFSISRLADMTGTNNKYVSQVINVEYNMNFNQLLAKYRIKKACQYMEEEKYNNYTIEAIGQSVGYHSRSNFVMTFKKAVGLSPSVYHKIVISNKKKPIQDIK